MWNGMEIAVIVSAIGALASAAATIVAITKKQRNQARKKDALDVGANRIDAPGEGDHAEAGQDARHVAAPDPPDPSALPSEPAPTSYLVQIPEPVADFVGRADEIEELLAAFEGAGQGAVIVGARGMGGVGKTELAKVLAKRLKGRFRDGQIYFNLRGASDDTSAGAATAVEALSHVIRSFHPDAKLPEDMGALQGVCHSVLEGKRVLLLMDNALDAAQLAPLAPPPDGCALMVTSRHRFELAGMDAIDLDTLPPGDAQELLLDICDRIGDAAAALAKRCGHLPLALRLAASALKSRPTLGVEKYMADLGSEEGRLAALDKYKGATGEDLGIAASLAISYDLLDEGMQGFWRALGVFPDDFDAAAAAEVCPLPDGQDVETALGDLYAASMVQWEEATKRFRLHDLRRDYARDQLSEDERAGDELRHAQHYLAVLGMADEVYKDGGESILQGLALFDHEWGNIRSGQEWAAARRGTDKTAAELCRDYPDAGPYCLNLRLHSREWIAWIEAAVEAARTLEDRNAEGNHLGNLGLAYARLGETRKAIEFYEQRIVIAKELGDRRGEGNALDNLGNAYAALGDPHKAIELSDQRIAIAKEIGDRRGEGNALGNLGNAYAALGDPRKAIESYEKSLVIHRELGDWRAEGQDLGNLGYAYADLGDPRKAIEYYEQALAISRKLADRRSEGAAMGNLGLAYADLGEPGKAIECYEQALVISREIGDRRGEGNALGNLGIAYAALGEPGKAIEFHEQQLLIAQEIGDLLGEGNASHSLVDELSKVGRGDEAVAYAAKALGIYEAIESPDAAKARAQLERLRE